MHRDAVEEIHDSCPEYLVNAARAAGDRMVANGKRVFVGGASDRPIDIGKLAATLRVPFPHFGWRIARIFTHVATPVVPVSTVMYGCLLD